MPLQKQHFCIVFWCALECMILEINVCSQVLRVLTDGVEELSLMKMPGIDGVFAIIAFSCHRAASMAKRMLVEGR